MAERNFSPSLLLDIANQGQAAPSRNPGICIYHQSDIAVVFEKCSKKIINVGSFRGGAHDLDEAKTEDEQKKAKEKVDEAIKKILEGAKRGGKKGQTKQWEKPGGFEDAEKDFGKMGATKIHPIPDGKAGTLPDGRNINVRTKSSDKRPTLEIQEKTSNKKLKIRYGIKP